ncbi:MAG: hypothetical protein QNJ16_10595 [Rhodobacter sp.]|nr:hypothetical protein [Rhodobacter sp.]
MTGATASNFILAGGTLLAALFVAIQAFYARSSYVEAEASKFLERKLDICFQNFDDAARLDAALRLAVPGMATQDTWPPKVVVETPEALAALQREVVPMLDALDAGLTKATVLDQLDKYRAYLAQQIRGLSKRLLDLTPAQLGPENEQTKATLAVLSDFLGAQYSVFTGCRLIAEGKT